jgi:hypothetical protein
MKCALFNRIRFSKPSDVCWEREGLIGKFMEIVTRCSPHTTTYSRECCESPRTPPPVLKLGDYISHPCILWHLHETEQASVRI